MPQAKRKKAKTKREPVITPKVRAGLRESILFLLTRDTARRIGFRLEAAFGNLTATLQT